MNQQIQFVCSIKTFFQIKKMRFTDYYLSFMLTLYVLIRAFPQIKISQKIEIEFESKFLLIVLI